MIPLPGPQTYGLALNHVMQVVATLLLWGGTLALLGYSVVLARRERSPLPVMIVVAVATGSINEPIYDLTYHLYWLGADPHGHGPQWTLFTAFGLPQPVWVMPAYVMVFALPALLLYRSFARGVSMQKVVGWAALTACTTAVFETVATTMDLYTYYGDAPLRLLRYPLWISVMEAAQITGYALLCAVIKLRAPRPAHCLVLLVVFPANFAFETLGAGFPTLISMNTPNPSTALMWAMAPVSMALAATGLWWTAQLLFFTQRWALVEGRLPSPGPLTQPFVAARGVAQPVVSV
jgi:hypothetical protein